MTRRKLIAGCIILGLLVLLTIPLSSITAQGCVRDPDCDGLAGNNDACPNVPGPAENRGCPLEGSGPANPTDPDGDGVVGGSDFCPNAGGHINNNGCPPGEEPQGETPNEAPAGPTATPFIPLPSLPDGECMAATLDATRVNIRSLPGTEGEVVGAMSAQVLYPVTGKFTNAASETWWHIEGGWVASWVTRVGQDCGRIPAFESEAGANLRFVDDFSHALVPDDPLPEHVLALFDFPHYDDLVDLPVKLVTCDGSVFVGVIGDLELPPDPCKLLLSNGLGVEILPQGIKLMYDDSPLGTFDFDDPANPVPPGGAGKDSFVAFPEAPDRDDPRETIIDTSEPGEDGQRRTFLSHDFETMGNPGGGLLIIGGDPFPDGAPFGKVVPRTQWDSLGDGDGDDGLHPLDLLDALEMQTCGVGGCLTLLIGDSPKFVPLPTADEANPDAGVLQPRDGLEIGEAVTNALEPIASTFEDCASVRNAGGLWTVFTTESNCNPDPDASGFDPFSSAVASDFRYYQAGTYVGLLPPTNAPSGIAHHWSIGCLNPGKPSVNWAIPYGSAFFYINDVNWRCTIWVTA